MIVRIHHWYRARSLREQRMLLLMSAIAVPLLIWLLFVLPLGRAHDAAVEAHLQAVDRNGRVLALAEAAKIRPARVRTAQSGDLQLLVAESATQSAIPLQGVTPNGPDTVEITAAGVRAPVAAEWLRGLEASGIGVAELRLTASADGSTNLTARLVRQP